jgi:hypothetical protein
MFPKRRKRGNKVDAKANACASADGVWSHRDNAALQALLAPLRKAPEPALLGCFSSEARGLACTPKHEVYDRLMSYLATINIMSGLVLSSIASLVTSPMNVSKLPADTQLLGDAFNVLAYVAVTTQVKLPGTPPLHDG